LKIIFALPYSKSSAGESVANVFESFILNFSTESALAFYQMDKLTGFAVIVPEKNDH
jgi:hypothetical protein